MPQTSKAVFLSYASQDAEAARRICESLRNAGVEVWFDQSELRGGDAWDQKIRRQIRDCALFIPIISANTALRHEGYFRLEWDQADQRTHMIARDRAFIIPVCTDSTPDRGTDMPESFVRVQWTRLPGGETPPAFVERVTRLLAPVRNETPVAGASSTQTVYASSHSGASAGWRRRTRVVPLAIAMLAALAGGYFVLDKFVLAKRSAGTAQDSHSSGAGGAAGQGAIPEKSIAVLPFADLSEKKDQEYLANGIAASVLDRLAMIPGLRVISHLSSFHLKENTSDPRAIGSILGVTYVVNGTVSRSGDAVRVTAALVDARDGSQRWSSTYKHNASDIFKVQEAIAANLARTLQLTIAGDLSSRTSTKNGAAYDLYLRGMRAMDQWTKEGTAEAIGEFKQALSLDPTFAPAALLEAKAYRESGVQAWLPADSAFGQARESANIALRLDPTLGEAHAVLAEIATSYDWDVTAAEAEIKLALEHPYGGVETLQAQARLAAFRNEFQKAAELFQTALAIDPLDANLHVLLGWAVYLRSGRYPEAEAALRRTLEISPDYSTARWYLGQALLLQGRRDEALDVMQHESVDGGRYAGMAVVYHAMGKATLADAALKRAVEANAELYPSAIAKAFAYCGNRDEAFKWLEKAYAVKDADFYFIRHEPMMKSLEGDARYQAFLKKANLPS